ncbi:MAG: 30S ribosomal protein S3 [Micavibrio sp.]|nr:30S ribosomal protein S3 [Micavibrio sp.]|tara:strand:- start:309 stop:1010 length:702 start_codon:yes stop_codon:yes gene_type:complete
MGQKINPIGLRVGINRTWDSRWYAGNDYAKKLVEDLKLREYIQKELKAAGISKVIIERAAKNTRVTIYTARPGVIIGKKGADIEKLRQQLSSRAGGEVSLNIVEIRKPETDAQLVAEGVCQQLERRVSFRRAMKRAVQSALRFGSLGIRINVSGRLGGADIARTEWYREGRVPLHTLRADLDYGFAEALTTYGIIGVKVWLYKGDILEHDPMARDKRVSESQGGAPRRDGEKG